MKLISVLFFTILSQSLWANYFVGRPLQNSMGCPNLLYTTSAQTVQDHPMLGVPAKVLIAQRGQEVEFAYQGWNRSWDSIISVYLSEAGDRLYFDDACYDDGKLVPCLSFGKCSYYAGFL